MRRLPELAEMLLLWLCVIAAILLLNWIILP
jgi:hypothetical protein